MEQPGAPQGKNEFKLGLTPLLHQLLRHPACRLSSRIHQFCLELFRWLDKIGLAKALDAMKMRFKQ
jgi:hypothetical protein